MFLLVHQNGDLCDVNGYAFTSLQDALRNGALTIGNDLKFRAASAKVEVTNGPTFPCHVVKPIEDSDRFCREGRMWLIVQSCYAADVAVYLTRRNKAVGGTGRVVLD